MDHLGRHGQFGWMYMYVPWLIAGPDVAGHTQIDIDPDNERSMLP